MRTRSNVYHSLLVTDVPTVLLSCKKRELFQNLNKLREARAPFNNVIVIHNLTKTEGRTKNLINQTQDKERENVSGCTCIG